MSLTIEGPVSAPREIRYVPRSEKVAPPRAAQAAPSLALRGWRAPLHWVVPPAFENPRQALIELGVEAYKDAVREYYSAIREAGVERAQRTHSKWVVRLCVRAFETNLRRLERQRARYVGDSQPDFITPREMYESSRLTVDLAYWLKRYQVPENLREATERIIRSRLRSVWGLK